MEQFYAATQEILTQGGLGDIGKFDYNELAKIFSHSFLKNVDESGNCVVDLSTTKLTAETQKALYMLMQSQKIFNQNKGSKRSRRAKSEMPFQDQFS